MLDIAWDAGQTGPIPKKTAKYAQKRAQDAHRSELLFPCVRPSKVHPVGVYTNFAPDTAKLWPVHLFSNVRIYERIGGLYDASLGF